jgi:A/G-specific adenine glycosylase
MIVLRATNEKVQGKRTVGDVRRRGSVARFHALVWNYWKENGRHDLPWRKTNDPYRILVSEVMLQQTQVPRVIEKYEEFLKAFPNVRALAKAPLSDVLKIWSGLGYNRRAKYLHDAAKQVVAKQGGKVPRDFAALRALPGVGPYTASAVRVFAFNEPDILIETNIRTAYIHHFFKTRTSDVLVSDGRVHELANRASEGKDPREWHWALMDYGSHLKRSGIRNNHRSAHYTKQSKFDGSLRQVRGSILRELHACSRTEEEFTRLSLGKVKLKKALAGLVRDGLIKKEKGKWRIA